MFAFDKRILKLLNFASPNNIRPTLAWLLLTKDKKIVATDSYKLCEFPLLAKWDPKIIPLDSFEPLKEEDVWDWIMLPRDFLKNIKFCKVKNFDAFWNCVLWNFKNTTNKIWETKRISWFTSDLSWTHITWTWLMKSKFPEYKKWFEQEWEYLEVWLWAELMRELLEAYSTYDFRWVVLKISKTDKTKPVIVIWHWSNENWDWEDFRSLIMPLSI